MPRLSINGNLYSPRLLLFDVDGTLIDDSLRYRSLGKARYNAIRAMASENTAKEWAKLTGVDPDKWSIDPDGPISKAPRRDDLALAGGALYLDGHSWYEARALAEKIYEKADKEQRKSFKPRLYEGAEDKLRELEKAGFMLGIATNGVTKITEELLDDLDIGELFSVVVGADMVERSKPAPDMILHACKIAECKRQECLYIGDQATDMEAAKSASILLGIGVRNPDLDLIKGIEFIDSITEIEIIKE